MFMSLWACLQSSRVTKVREVPFLLKQIKQKKRVRLTLLQFTARRKRPRRLPTSSLFRSRSLGRHATHLWAGALRDDLSSGGKWASSVSYFLPLGLARRTNEPLGYRRHVHVLADYRDNCLEIPAVKFSPVLIRAATETQAVCVIGQLDCTNS